MGRFWNANTLNSNGIILSDKKTDKDIFCHFPSNLVFIKHGTNVKAKYTFQSHNLIYTFAKDEGEHKYK